MKKQPIALLVNDLHVNKDNISEFNKNWDEALGICKEYDICDLIIGGDMWTTRSGQTLGTLLAVKHALLKATSQGINITIAEGNHDKVDQEQEEGYSHIFTEYNNVEIVNDCSLLAWEGTPHVLAVMSYFPEQGSFRKRLESFKQDIQKLKMGMSNVTLYIHEGIAGGLPGGFVSDTDLPTDIFEGFAQVLVGHYHNRTHIKGTNIWYVGSSRQDNFGEDANKGYTILFDDGTTQFVQNEVNIRYVNVECGFSDLDSLPEYSDPNCKVKLKLTCDETQSKLVDRQKLLDKGINRIEIITKKKEHDVSQSAVDEKYDASTIKQEYLAFCKQEKIDSELGEQYLNKINQPCGN